MKSPGASLRFIRKRFRPSEKGFGQQPVETRPRHSRKRKKIYFVDPFQYHCLGGWSSGYSNYFDFAQKIIADPLRVSRLLEGVVAGHLAGHFPKIAFWRNRGEIDFICVSNGKVRMFAELKYQSQITSDDKKGLRKTKGGLLLTKDRLKIDETNHIYMVPVDLFLSVLPE